MERAAQGESSVPQDPRTYDEIINDSWTTEEDARRAKQVPC
jgi:hypothetical protein